MAPVANSPTEEVDEQKNFETYLEMATLAMNAGGEESDKQFAGPIGAFGAQAILVMIQLATMGELDLVDPEKELDESAVRKVAPRAIFERGILQEAAFQAFCDLSDDVKESGVNAAVTERALKLYVQLKPATQAFGMLAMNQCLQMGEMPTTKPDKEPPRRELTGLEKPALPIADPSINPAFVSAMKKPTYDVGLEGSFDFVGPIVERGLCKCKPIDLACSDSTVKRAIAKLEKAGEISVIPPLDSMKGCLARGVMGIAALEALQTVDPAILEKEHVFDRMKLVVQQVGPWAMQLHEGVVESLLLSIQAADRAAKLEAEA